ncbi:MAG: prepilin peptidase [Proteobacteria bacterium]|nr:prepilin peptidase [Pseudomonadota bacterium]
MPLFSFPPLSGIEAISLCTAALILLAAAAMDFRKFKISNWLSLALAALFPVYALAAHVPMVPHLLTGLAVFAAGFGLYALHLFGGGDAKLLAAAALWAGPKFVLLFLLSTTTLGGVLAAGFALAALIKSKKRSSGDAVVPWHKAPVPYGMAIACGGWMVLFLMARSTPT